MIGLAIGAYIAVSFGTMLNVMPHLLARKKIAGVQSAMILSFFWPFLLVWGFVASCVWACIALADIMRLRAEKIAARLAPTTVDAPQDVYRTPAPKLIPKDEPAALYLGAREEKIGRGAGCETDGTSTVFY